MMTIARTALLACVLLAVLAPSVPAQVQSLNPVGGFVENLGQWPTSARYVGRFAHMDVGVGAESVEFSLRDPHADDGRGHLLRLVLGEGLSAVGRDAGGTKVSFFRGSDPDGWHAGLPSWREVVLSGEGGDIRFTLRAEPEGLVLQVRTPAGVDSAGVSLRWEGGELGAGPGGATVETSLGPVRIGEARAWQELPGGGRVQRSANILRAGNERMAFDIPEQDLSLPTVAQATLSWSTFLGGIREVWDVDMMPCGDIVAAMVSASASFPTTPGAFDPDHNGSLDIVVARISPAGNAYIAATYLGGSDKDNIPIVRATSDGDVVVASDVDSADFPITAGAFDTSYSGLDDLAVSRLSGDLTELQWSTFLGGVTADNLRGLDVAPDGTTIVSGHTYSADFPTTPGAWVETHAGNGDSDGFITSLASDGSSLNWSTLLGGELGFDAVGVFRIAENGEILVSGMGNSPGIAATSGVFEESPNAERRLLCRLAADGSGVIWLAWLPGLMHTMAEQPDGDIVGVGGSSPFGGIPTTPGAYASEFPDPGASSPFAMRVSGDGTTVRWATYLPGPQSAEASAIDAQGRPVFAGRITASDLPTTPNAFQPEKSVGCADAFVSLLDENGAELLYSSYLGPTGFSTCTSTRAGITDGCGGLIMGGATVTGAFPTAGDPLEPTFGGGQSGWLARFQIDDPWQDIGGGLAGSTGTPRLRAAGGLCPGASMAVGLTGALPGADASLVVGLSLLGAPFKGGTLWPTPDLVLPPVPVGPQGALTFSSVLPPESFSGLELVVQFWVEDDAGPFGFAASNAVTAVAP